ncbi:hypothetical protein HYU93_01855 [Candidatus Daviesbacteria bacterium]|nr:hypothetical protein [Candidatus Daviesbacteria bacterium]
MTKQILRFQSEGEFQNFFGQLASAEFEDFQPVEGSGGDFGFDGIKGKTAYQVYYPTKKSQSLGDYKDKIDEDVEKVLASEDKLGFDITDWVLVVPEDLTINVISHLTKKSKETGITCTYWGATKLQQLVTRHPHIQDSFPLIFLPPVRKGIQNLQEIMVSSNRPKILDNTIEIMTDTEYEDLKKIIISECLTKTKALPFENDPSSNPFKEEPLLNEMNEKLARLKAKKQASSRAFQLEADEINEAYKEECEQIEKTYYPTYRNPEADKAYGKAANRRDRALERVRMKYGETRLKGYDRDGRVIID